MDDTSSDRVCEICQRTIPLASWSAHSRGKRHCQKAMARNRAILNSASRDRRELSISHPEAGIDFGVIDPATAPQAIKFFIMKAMTPTGQYMVMEPKWSSVLSSARTSPPFTFSIEGNSHLRQGHDVHIAVRPSDTSIGHHEDILEIKFASIPSQQQFMMTRSVKAVVGDEATYVTMLPTTPYVPRRKGVRSRPKTWTPGLPPARLLAISWRTKLGTYDVPKKFRPIFSTPSLVVAPGGDVVPESIRTLVPRQLRESTYSIIFSMMLWLEEISLENDLHAYDMEGVPMTKHGVYHHLRVPGLAEKRPSVVIGDTILARVAGVARDKWYEGHVHYVQEQEIGLRFHGSLPSPGDQRRYDVHFQLNRVTLRRQHQSLNSVLPGAAHFLLPLPAHVGTAGALSAGTLPLHDHNILNNTRQLHAVKRILSLPPGASAPFILFGPPGTGKTVTIVEAIKQILRLDPIARLLVCAPSNSAADIIAQRLSGTLGTNSLFRFYAPSRERKTVPAGLLPYTFTNSDGLFSHPPLETVRAYRVIVSTCVSAGFVSGIGVERGHYSHIFIDEAGQATEPETMVAVKNIASATTKVVLSGDPKQLRPIVRSAVADALGLGISYLERLMERDAYRGPDSHGASYVKLLKNYRSHHEIIRFPSARFYNEELEPCGEATSINSCLNLTPLVLRKFPVIFCSVAGQDMREASSPSFFNPQEAMQVKAYVQQLLGDSRAQPRVEAAHIGIIAPYRAQCQKLRAALRQIAPEIKVGSVEEFQGDERRIIIITTVRSSRDFVSYDLRYTLGFVANPRRFNVAVTRAKALLIVVGDPLVLGLDPLWRAFLNSVHAGGGWRGQEIPWDPLVPVNPDGGYDAELRARAVEDADALAQRLLEGAGDPDAGEDQPFRELEE